MTKLDHEKQVEDRQIVPIKPDRVIVGCGDIGRRLAALYQNSSKQTRALVNSETSAAACKDMGLDTKQINLDEEADSLKHYFNQISECQLFYFVPPPKQGTLDTRITKVLDSMTGKVKINKCVLISTTGVYGDCEGRWINETETLKPIADRSQRRYDAEQQWIKWAEKNHTPWIILRVSGIYAKDRLPLQRLMKQVPMIEESHSPWTNRIHADDLANICKLSMEQGVSNEIINVCDGHPSTMTSYFDQVATYAGLNKPPKISYQQALETLSPGMVSYLKESRRIENSKMMDKLGIKALQYPNLEMALQQFSLEHDSLQKSP